MDEIFQNKAWNRPVSLAGKNFDFAGEKVENKKKCSKNSV